MKRLLALLAALFLSGWAHAQSEEPADANIIRAGREETQVVFDLGRYLGAISEMEQKQPKLALSPAQARQLLPVLNELKMSKRVTPEAARKALGKVQALLTVEQRKAVLLLAEQESEAGGNGANRELFLSWAKGGPFNPFLNAGSVTGKAFAALTASMEKRSRA